MHTAQKSKPIWEQRENRCNRAAKALCHFWRLAWMLSPLPRDPCASLCTWFCVLPLPFEGSWQVSPAIWSVDACGGLFLKPLALHLVLSLTWLLSIQQLRSLRLFPYFLSCPLRHLLPFDFGAASPLSKPICQRLPWWMYVRGNADLSTRQFCYNFARNSHIRQLHCQCSEHYQSTRLETRKQP